MQECQSFAKSTGVIAPRQHIETAPPNRFRNCCRDESAVRIPFDGSTEHNRAELALGPRAHARGVIPLDRLFDLDLVGEVVLDVLG